MATIDYTAAALLVTWTVAIVAGVRARVPKLDGWWVVLLTAGASAIASAILFVEPLPEWLRYALLAWSGAIGGVSFADRVIDRVARSKNGAPNDRR